jgi:hypothetical protein
MTVMHALPTHGDVFFDIRDDGRNLRLSWHDDQALLVLSTWRHGSCTASCQLDRQDVARLVTHLVEGLAAQPTETWTEPTYVEFAPSGPKLGRLGSPVTGLLRSLRPRRRS